MGFGSGSDEGILKKMSEIMKECGGEFKRTLNN